jgi:hypothetical protein
MENLISAGKVHFKDINYSLFWDASNGEIWFSQDNGHVKFQVAYLSSPTKEMVAETFIDYLKSQE